MNLIFIIYLYFSTLQLIVVGQLAAIYSDVRRSSDCASWSSWGSCIPLCQSHWFYRFIGGRYATALNSFFEVMEKIIKKYFFSIFEVSFWIITLVECVAINKVVVLVERKNVIQVLFS
ncbi:unnamed protein product [Meloidogyne enterolobii]|uniref:Uncharacterized protein n=1 Tax=Meloidogyne enterolobii TaxID=390850 RepID=A0ACB0ZED1_MELEN